MSNLIRETLTDIVRKYGTSIVDDPRRLEALLHDLCPSNKREINLLTTAMKDGVASDLVSSSTTPVELLVGRLTARLRDNCGLTDEAARWTVETWALALGRISSVAPTESPGSTPPISVSPPGPSDAAPLSSARRASQLNGRPGQRTLARTWNLILTSFGVWIGVLIAVVVIGAIVTVLTSRPPTYQFATGANPPPPTTPKSARPRADVFTTLCGFTIDTNLTLFLGGDGTFCGIFGDTHPRLCRIAPEGKISVLHALAVPDASSVCVQGSDGTLYGATSGNAGGNGGAMNGPGDFGTVFKITPTGTPITIHRFSGGADGVNPDVLIQGSNGDLYGTTQGWREAGIRGTVFRITPAGALTTLHAFTDGADGETPTDLVQGSDGNLYGITGTGLGDGDNSAEGPGSQSKIEQDISHVMFGNDNRTVFKITPAGALTTIYTFPAASTHSLDILFQGHDGNLYGVSEGRAEIPDTVFKVTRAGMVTTLCSLAGYCIDALVQAGNGDLYGTTPVCGSGNNGAVFRITPAGDTLVVHCFTGGADGRRPGQLCQGRDGNIYGTTIGGGANGHGTFFRIKPAQ